MKIYKYLMLATLGSILSCNNDDTPVNQPTTDYLVVGDPNVNVSLNSTVNMLYYQYDPEHNVSQDYECDLDNDGTNDFRYRIVSSPSMTSGFKVVSIQSLHINALFISNNSIVSPEILNVGDTLRITNNAIENVNADYGAELYRYDKTSPPFGQGVVTEFGLWNGADHKNVGLMVKKNDVIVYGWTELSVDDEGLYIHKIASKPCLY